MKTILSMLLLLIYGVIGTFLMFGATNFLGLPGVLVACGSGLSKIRSGKRYVIGAIVSAIGQSYANLAFVSFMVSWTHIASDREDVVGFLIWPIAFLAVMLPTLANLTITNSNASRREYADPQGNAYVITFFVTLLAFPLFAILPVLMKAWEYIPMVSSVVGSN